MSGVRVLSCIVVKFSYLSPSLFCCLMKGHTSWSETSCSYNFYPYREFLSMYVFEGEEFENLAFVLPILIRDETITLFL